MVGDEADQANAVPAYFLVKLKKGERYHYVFCEMVASCNYPAGDAGGEQCKTEEFPFLPRQALEDLLANQTRNSAKAGISEVEAAVLSEPGNACAAWTTFSARRQSGDDEDPIG